MKKRPRGRPPKDESEQRSVHVTMRFTREERELLEMASDGQISTWGREVLLRAARRKAKTA